MSVRATLLSLVTVLAPVAGQDVVKSPGADPVLVERVEIAGNQYLQSETLLYYVATKPGDGYDERKLREDFRRLWDTGFLDDLHVEAFDAPGGKRVRFTVTERKRIQIVDYRGSRELTGSTIEDELKKRDTQVKLDSFYDAQRARKVEAVVKEMLAAKGRPFASVKHEAKSIGSSGQQLSFVIDDGPRAKIHEIVFEGNQVYSDGRLRGELKQLKTPGFFNLSWLGGKTTFTQDKWLGGAKTRAGIAGGSRTSTWTTGTSPRGSDSRGSATATGDPASSGRRRSSTSGSRSRSRKGRSTGWVSCASRVSRS